MSDEFKPLPLDPATRDALPLGYARILYHENVIDEQTSTRLRLVLPKYRHASLVLSPPDKPISKPDL